MKYLYDYTFNCKKRKCLNKKIYILYYFSLIIEPKISPVIISSFSGYES